MKFFSKIKKSLKHSLKVKITHSILRAPSVFKHKLANKVQDIHREVVENKLTFFQRLKMFFFHNNNIEEYKFSKIRRLFLHSYAELSQTYENKNKAYRSINKIFPLINFNK